MLFTSIKRLFTMSRKPVRVKLSYIHSHFEYEANANVKGRFQSFSCHVYFYLFICSTCHVGLLRRRKMTPPWLIAFLSQINVSLVLQVKLTCQRHQIIRASSPLAGMRPSLLQRQTWERQVKITVRSNVKHRLLVNAMFVLPDGPRLFWGKVDL